MESEVLKQIHFQMFLPEPPVSPWATVLPLVLVMGVCMVKQVMLVLVMAVMVEIVM